MWAKSGEITFDNSGNPAKGAKAYFYQGNTTTPISVYSDAAESSAHTQPVTADGSTGRWPLVFIPFRENYDVKVTTSGGTQLYYFQAIPNPDPVEEASASVDASELIATGDVIWRPVGGTRTGFVRCNGRTMGNASSGGTERANADTEDLFTHLWNGLADGQAAVSGGRGASAAADYAANKTITLPDLRGRGIRGVDDMGNSAASAMSGISFTHGDATTAGSDGGGNVNTIATTHLPSHAHSVSITSSTDGAHTHTGTTDNESAHTHTGTAASDGAHTHTGTSDAGGSHTHTGTTGNDSPDHTHSYTDTTSSANMQAGAGVNVSGTTAGTTGGASARHTHTFTTDSGGSHQHSFTTASGGAHTHSVTTGAGSAHSHSFTTASNGSHSHTVSGNTGSVGSGTALPTMSRSILGTFYMKL